MISCLDQFCRLDDVIFVPFDQEDYQIVYSNGTIATIDSSQVTITNGTQLTITGLAFSQSNVTVNVVVEKQVIKNKVKDFIRCTQTAITRSTNLRSGVGIQTSVNDGLTIVICMVLEFKIEKFVLTILMLLIS